jgi:putative transposase
MKGHPMPQQPSRHERLIDRILPRPSHKLSYVEDLVTHLECGDSSPLSTGSHPLNSTSDAQRFAARVAATQSPNPFPHPKHWPHAPFHRLDEHGTYFNTKGTLHKEHRFAGPERLDLLESALLRILKEAGWRLEAWAVFSNHYHFVAHSQPGAQNLRAVLRCLHGETAGEVNRLDGTPGRTVWHNFWETKLTFEKSYLARLNYVHQNAVKHGLVPLANQYRWCSAAWFERTATRAQVRTIYGFKTDKLNVPDDFEPR